MKQTTTNRLLLFSVLWVLISAFSLAQAQTVYITKTGEKYHKENCQHLQHSKIAIQKSDAVLRGYTACLNCKPGAASSGTGAAGIERYQQAPSYQPQKSSVAVQCSGTTQAGLRCKNKTTNSSGRCYHHN